MEVNHTASLRLFQALLRSVAAGRKLAQSSPFVMSIDPLSGRILANM